MNIPVYDAVVDFGVGHGGGDAEIVLLKDHIASHAYDEAKERELRKKKWFSDWSDYSITLEKLQAGWPACAKSGALS